MADIKVAIIGVGNCASSFLQGITKYADAGPDETIPGLMHPVMGEYGIGDIKVVAAFDVDANKVGKDLSEAIFSEPNNTMKFQDVPDQGVAVQRGMTHDGVGRYTSELITKAPGGTDNVEIGRASCRERV